MRDIKIKIQYNIDTNTFTVDGNVDDPKHYVGNFLRTQIGAGTDDSFPNSHEVYEISIELDLTDDTFYVNSNCGNEDLRDGILSHYIRSKRKE